MKKTLFPVLKFVLTFILSLVVLELFLRSTSISLPSVVTDDARMGRVFRPNAELMVLTEGFCMGKINKYGYTGPAYPPERKNGALRIALVGDSYIEGHYLFEQYYFGRILEEKLSRSIDRDVEVLNFGMAGFDFRRTYICYKERVQPFNPDITLFFIDTGDLLNRDDNLGPRCVMADGSLKISFDFARSEQFKRKRKFAFFRRFSFYPLLQKDYALYKLGHSGDILLGALNPFPSKKGDGETDAPRLPFPAKDGFLEVNRAILESLHSIELEGNTRIIIVQKRNIPHYYKRMIAGMGLQLIDVSGELEKLMNGGIDPYYWKATNKRGHWNHDAHRAIGNFLAAYLAKEKEEQGTLRAHERTNGWTVSSIGPRKIER